MIVFTPASEADFERLLDLRIRVMREHLERIGRFDPERARKRFRDGYQPEHLRLIEIDGVFAGCVSLKPRGDHFEIEHFYLQPERQGRGLGAEVIATLLTETDAATLPVRLGVLKQSPAGRFYERHGFERTHEEEWDVYYERKPATLNEPELVLTDAPDDRTSKAVVDNLLGHNREAVGFVDGKPLAVFARDPKTGVLVGGMTARTSFGNLTLEYVFLSKALRGRDVGSRMLQAIEDEAKKRGCRHGVLVTLSFQAPGFYAKRGWREFGRVPCNPPGSHRIFMMKTLAE